MDLLQQLRVSLESSEMPENVEINPVTDQTETELDQALAEVEQAESDVASAEVNETVLEAAADGVEETTEAIEDEIEEKGEISQESYAKYDLALRNATRLLPLDHSRYQVSQESFVQFDGRTVSMEALDKAKEMLAKLWQAVKDAVTKVWGAIREWFARLGKSGAALIAAGNDLKKRASAARGKTAKNDKIDATAAARLLHDEGKFDSVATAISGLATSVTVGREGGQILTEAAAEYTKQMASVARLGVAETSTISFDKEFVEAVSGFKEAYKKYDGKKSTGGYVFHVESVSGGLGVSLTQDTKFEGDATIATPTPEQVSALGQAIVDAGTFVKDFDKKYFKDFDKTLVSDLNKARSSVNKELSDSEQKRTKIFLALIRFSSGAFKKPMPAYVGNVANQAKAAYKLGRKALAQYGEPAGTSVATR
ncbi:hypothetical protein ACLPJK_26690 [Pseudomonas aeruginosa]|uniref:hypothetical protein n=1 Tax=Pseudomonas aeruginosa TaxID=287 RepID=UPI003D295DE4